MSTRSTSREPFDPWAFAAEYRIDVERTTFPLARWASWHPSRSLIRLRAGMTERHERWCLCHELAHAWLGHAGCEPAQERAADWWAADRLISRDSYREAESLYGRDLAALATELDVPPRAIVAWREMKHERRWSAFFRGEDLIA